MAKILFSNDASSLLAASIDAVATSVQVSSGGGASFPNPGADEFFKVALVNDSGDLEIVHCTSRSGDILTVTRAQEGTSAQAWTLNATRVELRNTAGSMEAMLQKAGDSMTGNLDMNQNEIQDAVLTGSNTVIEDGEIVGVPLRGASGDASNEIAVPSDGSAATMGGSAILTAGSGLSNLMPIGTILMWYGSLGNIPGGFQLCDGTNGTPDLRSKFVKGAGGSTALASTGGSSTGTANTSSAGLHNHGITVNGHALTFAQIPNHQHDVFSDGVTSNNQRRVADSSDDAKAVASTMSNADSPVNGAPHSHTATSNNSGSHTHNVTVDTEPPWVGIYYIMRVAP